MSDLPPSDTPPDAKPSKRRRRRRRRRRNAAAREVQAKKPPVAKPEQKKPEQKKGEPRRGAGKPAPDRRRRRRLRVVAAVIEVEERLLVSLRHPKKQRPSQWEFPGGKIEKGESERQALIREIREELGVRCEVRRLVKRVVHPFTDTDVEIAFYETIIVEGDPQPLCMAEIRWVHRADLPQLDFLEADRPFVAELARGRQRNDG